MRDLVREAFRRNFDLGMEVGAAFSLWHGEEEVASYVGGFQDAARLIPWTPDTLVLIWSATKGLSAACAVHALARANLDLANPVADVWPAFAQAGKASVTFGHLLSHSAGLGALDRMDLSLAEHDEVIAAIEQQAPLFPIGTSIGYGPRTFGFLVDEIVRRVGGGLSLGEYWRTHFAEPMNLDLWIGLPAEEHARTATMLAPRLSSGTDAFTAAMADPQSATRRAFSSPGGIRSVSSMNTSEVRSLSLPSLGAIGSARALAKFYAMLAGGGRWAGREFFTQRELGWMTTRAAQGFDHILRCEVAFSTGFMMDPLTADGAKLRAVMGPSLMAFGHPGAGGSLAFADPENGLGFAYVMNQMEPGVLPSERALSLVHAVYEDLH